MEKIRLPKYKRQHGAINVQLTDDDIELFTLIHKFRFLNSVQLSVLTSRNVKKVRERLQRLYHNQYLDRPRNQNNYDNSPIVHALGNKGAQLLLERGVIDPVKADWTTKNREVQNPFIRHEMMINDFRIALTAALRARLVGWRSDLVFEIGQGKLIPDGFFGIETNGRRRFYFLEADRSTMTGKLYYEKLKKYWALWKSGVLPRRLKGVDNFRVLTLAKTAARAENLRKRARDVDDRKEGSALFCFASTDGYDLTEPASVLNVTWTTAKGTREQVLTK